MGARTRVKSWYTINNGMYNNIIVYATIFYDMFGTQKTTADCTICRKQRLYTTVS